MQRRHVAYAAAIAAVAAFVGAAAACSKSSGNTTGPSAACTAPPTSTTITISGNAVCPQNITVALGTQVTFVNQDSRAHEMSSDPHPDHTDCPEINSVGHLESTQSRQTGNLNTARRCGFHDHISPDTASLRGSITIQ